MFDPDAWMIKQFSKLKFLNINNWKQARHVAIHFTSSGLWASFWSPFIKMSPWFWFTVLAWLGYVFYYEAFSSDQHWARIKLGKEAYDAKNGAGKYDFESSDLRADIITKLAGLIFYVEVFYI